MFFETRLAPDDITLDVRLICCLKQNAGVQNFLVKDLV